MDIFKPGKQGVRGEQVAVIALVTLFATMNFISWCLLSAVMHRDGDVCHERTNHGRDKRTTGILDTEHDSRMSAGGHTRALQRTRNSNNVRNGER